MGYSGSCHHGLQRLVVLVHAVKDLSGLWVVGHGRYIPEVYRAILGPGQRSFLIRDLSESLRGGLCLLRVLSSVGSGCVILGSQ